MIQGHDEVVHTRHRADWTPLRGLLQSVDDRLTLSWSDLDHLVGGLPRSAYVHAAFWKGDRSRWPGFTAVDVEVGSSVTFVRRSADSVSIRRDETETVSPCPSGNEVPADIVLIGCVKKKLDRPAPARDMYTSALFRKGRAYAEATGASWFVLSAEHGLVAPTTVLEPYDLRLAKTSRDYRRMWGARVVEQLKESVGRLTRKVIEIHAGAAYLDPIRHQLVAEGAEVSEPLHGMGMGERLAWYGHHDASMRSSTHPVRTTPEASAIVKCLGTYANAITPAEFLASGGNALSLPGLYSWWVDSDGAATLTTGLHHAVEPGLIYAGLAGATRPLSGRKSKNTLWGRVRGMHLGGRHEFSTFRLSLGAILASVWKESCIDEERLTAWMHQHLRIVALPIEDAEELDHMETTMLTSLDPPLNLHKMPRSPVRVELTNLRRRYNRKQHSDT